VQARGADPARHTMLPLGFAIERELESLRDGDREALRTRLELPPKRRVVLSSAALNRYHKRLDYLIEEVARLPEPRPFVLMAGQPESETAGIRALAHERLGVDGHSIRTVPRADVPDLCRASDEFVLASTFEGLPRALIEALAHGLPCLAHDYPVTRFALGEHGRFADLEKPGALAGLLSEDVERAREPGRREARHRYAYDSFSWDRLRLRYVELLRGAAAHAG
jgi:glycosyltransferase involved in cell wall biosynthesis